MTRVAATIRLDVLNQFRQGFYYASAFVLVLMAVLLSLLPAAAAVLLPAILLTNMMVATFVFMGALLLLEKGQGTLEGLIVTPLRPGEYLLSKIIALTALAVIENVVITATALGQGIIFEINWGCVLLGSALSGTLYTLLGFLCVIRYRTLNEFLIPMMLVTILLEWPGLVCFGMPAHPVLYAFPTYGLLKIFQSAIEPHSLPTMVYAVVYPTVWILMTFALARQAFRRFITNEIGQL